jgi:signal recognition particle subunit SRP54
LSLKKQGKRPLLVACDIYRPAAIDQLKVVGEKAGVRVFEMGQENPVKIARESLKFAKDNGHDVVILDTAGRLHIDEQLMEELENIKAETSPNEILLVVDALTGQDAVNAAEGFNNKLGIDGIIMTKMDGDSRGGAALSAKKVTGKPVKFMGMGEKLDALEAQLSREFDPAKRAQLALEMQQVILDDHAFVFCSFLKMSMISKANVKNYTSHACDYYQVTADLDVE